jgi:hypothetical protein
MGRAVTRAVVSCLRCAEPNLLGGLPRCGCYVHALIIAPTAMAIAILDGAPRQPRRVRISASARARKRGVLARDTVSHYNVPPRWFTPAEAARTIVPSADSFDLPVFADERLAAATANGGDELELGGRRFARACTLRVEAGQTLRELQTLLHTSHGITAARLGRARVPPTACDGARESHVSDHLLVALPGTQLGCPAYSFFAEPGEVLVVW